MDRHYRWEESRDGDATDTGPQQTPDEQSCCIAIHTLMFLIIKVLSLLCYHKPDLLGVSSVDWTQP